MTRWFPRSGFFRKRPVVIRAYQMNEQLTDKPDWVVQAFHSGRIRLVSRATAVVSIDTREGTVFGYKDDWLIEGIQGEFYPCGDEIFRATYEAHEHND